MKQISKYIFVLIALIVCFSCKKYPEDKKISLATAKQRINQTWKFNVLIVNDVDSTAIIISYFNLNSPNELTMECEGFKRGSTGSVFQISHPAKYSYDKCEFDLFDRKHKLRMASSVALFPCENFYTSEWIIRKLTNKDFIIEGFYKAKKYRYEFVR